MRGRPHLLARLLALTLTLAACDDATTSAGPLWPPLSAGLVEPTLALPGTHLRIAAKGLVPSDLAGFTVRLVGAVDGRPVDLELPAIPHAEVLEVPLGAALTDQLMAPSGRFVGTLHLARRTALGDGDDATSRPFELALANASFPALAAFSGGDAFPGDTLVAEGQGLLLPGEGLTLVRFDGAFTAESAAPRPIDGLVVPGATLLTPFADPATPLDRRRVAFSLTPDIFGIRPGRFEGTLRLVNAHADGTETLSEPLAVTLALRPPALTSLTPTAASRGQQITMRGRGLLPADGLLQTATVLLLEGVFTPRRGLPEAFEGPSAIVVYPETFESNTTLTAVLRVEVVDGLVVGLGSVPGRFEGTATPLVLAGPDAIEGAPLPIDFTILSPRQVVHIRALPSFADALTRFGLLAERAAIERRILEVVERDYAGVNITFTFSEPTDFAEYAIVELGGRDPNGTGLFGLDNTDGKDVGNLRFDDVIGGFNASTRAQNFAAYGGVFVSELMNLSPRLSTSDLASPRFDDIFGGLAPELGGAPARLGESEDFDERGASIRFAVRVLGNLIGSTVTHEVGHSLGLTAIEGRYHNEGDTPNAIMDAGQYRPFEERAEIDGFGPAVWEPFNRDYLESVLPLDP